jgi:hypothetical protein
MSGAIPPLPNTPSWRGAQKKAQGQLYFTLLYLRFKKRVHHLNTHFHSNLSQLIIVKYKDAELSYFYPSCTSAL